VTDSAASSNIRWHSGEVARSDRWDANVLGGATVWFTGLSGSGKSTIAVAVERLLVDRAHLAYLLDADNLRHGLNGDLGFSDSDRDENVRRVSEVARLFADAGCIALVPIISPFRVGRDQARSMHVAAGLPFIEVFVDTPIAECEQRDPKGLYAMARSGVLKGFTGIDAPYEPPIGAEVVLAPSDGDATELARLVVVALIEHGVIDR